MKTQNPYGRYLDSLMGFIDIGFWAIIGVMAYHHPKLLYINDPLGYSTIFWLGVGGLTCYFSVLIRYIEKIFDELVRDEWDNLKSNIEKDSGDIIQKGTAAKANNKNISSFSIMGIIQIINHNLRVRETQYFLLILAYLTHLVDLFLATFLIYYLFHTISLVVIYGLRGKQIRKSKIY